MNGFASLARLTLRDPPGAMAALRDLRLSMGARWALLALAASLSALLAGTLTLLFPVDPAQMSPSDALTLTLLSRPLLLAGMQFVGVVIAAGLVAGVGRLFGGNGTFADALLALAWIDLVVTAGEALQVAVVLVLPMLTPLLSLALFGLMIYLFVRMVGAVHGFRNPLLVALGMAGTMIAVGVALSLLVEPATLTRLMIPEAS